MCKEELDPLINREKLMKERRRKKRNNEDEEEPKKKLIHPTDCDHRNLPKGCPWCNTPSGIKDPECSCSLGEYVPCPDCHSYHNHAEKE